MIYLEDEDINPTEPMEPESEQPSKFALMMRKEALRYEKAAKEYATTMKRPKPEPRYEMTIAKINLEEHCLSDPMKVNVELTDNEYVYLLTRALLYGSSYRLTHLNKEHPALAQKIFEQGKAQYPDELQTAGTPYQMLFDEMHENAKEIIQLKDYFFPEKRNTSMLFI